MNVIEQCLQKAVKDMETTVRVFSVDLQVKVLAVSQWFHRRPLDAAEFGSLELWELVGSSPLKVGSISVRTFHLYLCFLPRRHMNGVERPG